MSALRQKRSFAKKEVTVSPDWLVEATASSGYPVHTYYLAHD